MKKTNKRSRHSTAHSRAHIKKLHHARVGLFSLLLLAVIIVRGDAGAIQITPDRHSQASVLAYSTSMSRTDLLNATNAFRTQNGLSPLAMNDKLNNSAQNKAQHMVSNDYWAHNAPDGTTPWYFFDAAGYSYSRAGENLAYGFATSQDAVDGWIASPGHRANMLGEYLDVGFGFVDGANYQGGQNTVVVAHYGTPVAPPEPAPAVAAASTPPPASPTPTPAAPAPAEQPTAEPSAATPSAKPTPTKPAETPEVVVASTANVSLLNQLNDGQPRLAALASILLVLSAVVGFALTHRSFVHHAAIVGERYVLTHPLVDTTVLAATILVILFTTVGHIA